MNTAVFQSVPCRGATHRFARWMPGPAMLRALLVFVCAASVATAWQVGDPSAALRADPELAHLLRGMAVLKGSMVVAAIAILAWRFAHPITAGVASSYLVSIGLMAASAAMIWQLTALLPAAAAFHAGLFVALIVSWRADGGLPVRSKIFR